MDASQRIVDHLYSLLVRFGVWPTWSVLDHEMDIRLGIQDPWAAISEIDRRFLWGIGTVEPSPNQPVGLSLAGLIECSEAFEDVGIFVDSVRFGAEVARASTPPEMPTLSMDDIAEHLALPAAGRVQVLRRQVALWQATGALWQQLHVDPDTGLWSVVLNRQVMRRLRNVGNAGDISAVIDPEGLTSEGAAASTVGPPPTVAPMTFTAVSGAVYFVYLDQPLGSGSQGAVFAAADAAGNPVAVKRTQLRNFSTEPWYRDAAYAEREAVAGALLEGRGLKHVLPLLDHLLDEDAFYFVYPRAERNLQAVISSPTLDDSPDTKSVRDICIDLTRGLTELHEHGVLHRDIKPDNALFWQGRWVWGDLGIARLIEAATATHTWRDAGALSYRAPERISGHPATQRSDVYSLGCTFYALMRGRPPFTGEDVATAHLEAAPDLSGLPDAHLSWVTGLMLAKQPGSRPSAVDVLEMLTDPPTSASTNALRGIVAASLGRETESAAVRARVERRRGAAVDALAQFDLFWDRLTRTIRATYPAAGSNRGQGAWILSIGDRRLVVQIAEPASGLCPALQLGTVTVEAADQELRSPVANLCAFPTADGPIWRLLRMVRNDMALSKAPVSEALSDKLGAVGLAALEEHLEEQGKLVAKSATTHSEEVLTVDALVKLFAAEVAAIDNRAS